jgi:hypothetical protein
MGKVRERQGRLFTDQSFARANGLCMGQERVKRVSGGGRIDRAARKADKRFVSINAIPKSKRNLEEGHLPDKSGATVPRHFAEEPDGCNNRVGQQQSKRNEYVFLLTLLIICDRDGELFPGLQTRVESGRVRAIRSQRRAGVPERTLRDGVQDRRPVIMARMSICERNVILSGTTYKKKNVTVVPLLAVKLLGLYTS